MTESIELMAGEGKVRRPAGRATVHAYFMNYCLYGRQSDGRVSNPNRGDLEALQQMVRPGVLARLTEHPERMMTPASALDARTWK
jgi:hypothetical protein